MGKPNRLFHAMQVALVAGGVGLLPTTAALAQDAPAQATTNLDSVQVVGSRIKRTDSDTSQPILALSREDIDAQGRTTIGEVLQAITAAGAAINSNINSGGSGQNRVSLRNLGSARTLILVNGRRWVGGTGLSGDVDLNSIPTAAVERVEVLKDGASAIYGSDAIGGVVNIILRENFDGAEFNAYHGQYDVGDGARNSMDFTIGTVRDRFSAVLGVSRIEQDAVGAGDRDISAVPVYGATPGFRGVANTPDGRFSLAPNGSSPFTNDGPGTPFRPFRSSDNYNTAPDRYLSVDQEMNSVFGNATLDLTDNLRLKLTSQYVERKTDQLLPVNAVVFGGLGNAYGRDIAISADSVYNPLGQDVPWGGRMITEAGGRLITRDVDTTAINLALEGTFTVGGRYWDWDAGYFFGRTRSHDTGLGQQDYRRIRDAVGPSMLDAGGNAVCVGTPGDLSTAIQGCVPLNLLGGAGSVTPEMVDYIDFVESSRLGYELRSMFANVTGELVQLPGGPLAFAAGLERREESGYDIPDALIASGVTNGNTREPTRGEYDVDEAYLEFAVPLVEGRPGMQLLELSIATRYSDYSNFGNTLNSKFGFRWKPLDSLMVRGNWSEGFRAPSIRELYQGQASNNQQNVTDPCAATLQGQPLPNPVSCAGVPASLDQSASTLSVTAGGNPEVGPETSVSRTLGMVYSPAWAPGLDLSVDWFEIKIDDTIATLGAQSVLNQCYRAGNNDMCRLVSRNDFGQITEVRNLRTNLGTVEVEGYDLSASYRLPEHDWGRLAIRLDTTYLARMESDSGLDIGGSGIESGGSGNQVGTGSNWRIRSNLMLSWQLGNFGVNWNVRYFSRLHETCTSLGNEARVVCSDPERYVDGLVAGPGDTWVVAPVWQPRNRIPSAVYNDINAFMDLPWNARVTLGVNNAFDRDPPITVTSPNSFGPEYEIPGRFFYMRYHQSF
ncbi:TonB-dependent receptor plug domain-containing protein [Stenotrophomonas tumulicola]|uniref:TonB-dependent receptor n=1 Tax=Stenotrophomonas tumulicola TaxID=1685415 RepID=A0A7W3IHP2_9GAMM|nr:TonB-dependent receptor [Stenotrophomonas tumulicola]MBA8681426.1 TonB-dependent receptor [Stenotrophomonas tumulicola]